MKTIKNITFIFTCLIILSSCAERININARKIIEEKNYVFIATSAIPMNTTDINNVLSKMGGNNSGGSINLTGSNYDLKILPDSIIAYLPYYGRAYTAPMNNEESGVKFTSAKFSYTAKKSKKSWQITISINDTKDNERLNLSISENGYATLNVSSNTKQSISYNGYIEER